MDPQTIATMAVSLIAPYLAKAGESIAKKAEEAGAVLAEKAAEATWGKIRSIYETVVDKLKGDAYAVETVKRLEAEPESKSRQAALTGVIEEKVKEDSTFASSLQKLLEEAREQGAEKIVQQIMISGHARTGDITTIGKIEGNVDLSKKRK